MLGPGAICPTTIGSRSTLNTSAMTQPGSTLWPSHDRPVCDPGRTCHGVVVSLWPGTLILNNLGFLPLEVGFSDSFRTLNLVSNTYQ